MNVRQRGTSNIHELFDITRIKENVNDMKFLCAIIITPSEFQKLYAIILPAEGPYFNFSPEENLCVVIQWTDDWPKG